MNDFLLYKDDFLIFAFLVRSSLVLSQTYLTLSASVPTLGEWIVLTSGRCVNAPGNTLAKPAVIAGANADSLNH
jgi:hypothetical protein